MDAATRTDVEENPRISGSRFVGVAHDDSDARCDHGHVGFLSYSRWVVCNRFVAAQPLSWFLKCHAIVAVTVFGTAFILLELWKHYD